MTARPPPTPLEAAPTPDHELLGALSEHDPSDRWLALLREARAGLDLPLATIGGYDILAQVGRGGQGIVYRARRTDTGAPVAIKRLRGGPGRADSPDARRRLERERDAAASLDHPAIVRPVAPTPATLEPAIVMEWVDGVPVTDWARPANQPARTVPEVLSLFLGICDAVQHAHQRGVIHRDLKPSNILVEQAEHGPRPRLLDFGLALLTGAPAPDASSAPDGRLIGTPLYAAPEQVLGLAADARADIYALALLLYRSLTGTLPFDHDGPMVDTLHRIAHEPPRRASASDSRIPRDLDAVLLKGLEKDPARRYQSVESFAHDLSAVLEHRPVTARLDSAWYRLTSFVARHRVASISAAAAVLLLAATTAVSVALAFRLDEQRRRSDAVAHFLQETLATAGPGRAGGGAGVTVLDALAAALKRADTELKDQPAVALEVYQAIGDTYRALWKFRDAIPPLERAAALATTLHGPRCEPRARALSTLGHCLANTTDPRAIDVQREALAIRRSLYTPRQGAHALVAESHMRLGYALYRAPAAGRQPDLAEAQEHLQLATTLARRLGDTALTAQCLHNLGYFLWHTGKPDDALEAYREGLSLFERTVPENAGVPAPAAPPAFVELLTGYASLLRQTGRTTESAAAYDRLLPILRAHYPDEALAPALRAHARLSTTLDDRQKALTLLQELRTVQARLHGQNSDEVHQVEGEIEQLQR